MMRTHPTTSGRIRLFEVAEPVVRAAIADRLGVEPALLAPAGSLSDDLAADSLDLLEVVIEVETTLVIAIPERDLESVRTVADLVRVTVTRLWERDHPALAPRPGRTGVAA